MPGPSRALLVLIAACAAGCATTGGTPRPFPGAPLPPAPRSTPAPPAGTPAPPSASTPVPPADTPDLPAATPELVATALTLRGAPYRNGGSDPSGFDCSGFVQWVFAQHGVTLPRDVTSQYRQGTRIDLSDVKPGDLLFFETVSRGASHVGVAIGGDQFVHAPSSRGVVRVERFTTNYWALRFVGARRVEGLGN